jgi:hypothetical protein
MKTGQLERASDDLAAIAASLGVSLEEAIEIMKTLHPFGVAEEE